LIFRKIIKIVAIVSHILKLRCSKFDVAGCGSAQLTALPRTNSWILRVLLLKKRRNGGKKKERKAEGQSPRFKFLATSIMKCMLIAFYSAISNVMIL